MLSGIQSRSSRLRGLLSVLVLQGLLLLLASSFAVAQIHGIPPSVTSIQNHLPPYLPNIPPSVTSLGPNGYVGPPAFPVYPSFPGSFQRPFSGWRLNGCGPRGRCGRGNGFGSSSSVFIAPVPVFFDASAGYDAGGAGSYLYSGPPAEQTLHIVVDLPPARTTDTADAQGPQEEAPPARSKREAAPDARPVDPLLLIFRDGHQQEVSNYAIMGRVLYVFDGHFQKIALSDLDLPATSKANDDRGVDFNVPDPGKS